MVEDHRMPTSRRPKSPIDNVVWVQLATRIPKNLATRAKIYALHHDTSLMCVIIDALSEKLERAKYLKSVKKGESA